MKVTVVSGNKAVETDITEEQAIKIGLIEIPKTGWERAEKDNKFYKITLDITGDVDFETDYYTSFNDSAFDKANYFTDENLANKMAKRISLMLRMQRWADEHNGKIDISDTKTKKYYIYYNIGRNTLDIACRFQIVEPFVICFISKELAEETIATFEKEILEVMKDE